MGTKPALILSSLIHAFTLPASASFSASRHLKSLASAPALASGLCHGFCLNLGTISLASSPTLQARYIITAGAGRRRESAVSGQPARGQHSALIAWDALLTSESGPVCSAPGAARSLPPFGLSRLWGAAVAARQLRLAGFGAPDRVWRVNVGQLDQTAGGS